MSTLHLDWLVDPPICSVADDGQEISAWVQLRFEGQAKASEARLRAAVAIAGRLPAALADGLARAVADLGNQGDLVTMGPEGIAPESLSAWVKGGCRTLGEALSSGKALLSESDSDSQRRLIVVAGVLGPESIESLLREAQALTEAGIGLDLICAEPSLDVGLLSRLASLGGGEVLDGEPGAALRERMVLLREQPFADLRLSLRFPNTVQPLRLYRVEPVPVFMGTLNVDEEDRRLVLDPGPIGAEGKAPSYLITLAVPKRRVGTYRLFEARVHHLGSEGPAVEAAILHRCSPDPAEAACVDARVVRAKERVEAAGWVDEAARAYAEGEARRVSITLDMMIRYFATLGHRERAERVAALRIHYLRTGELKLDELGWLRMAAAEPIDRSPR